MNHPLTVLIVDDESPIRQELRSFAWQQAQSVWLGEAKNGEEALAFCRQFQPDVVITDISMPVMDGLALVRALKSELPAIKVILLTCHSDFQYAREAIQLGALDYILKITMTDDQLREAIVKAREAIEREQSHRGQQQLRLGYEQGRRLREWAEGSGAAFSPKERDWAIGWEYPIRLALLHTLGDEHDMPFTDIEVQGAVDRLLRTDESTHAVLPYGLGQCLLVRSVHARDPHEKEAIRSWAKPVIAAAYKAIGDKLPFLGRAIRLCLVISPPIKEPSELKEALERLGECRTAAFYESELEVILQEDRPKGTGKSSPIGSYWADELQQAQARSSSLTGFLTSELPAYVKRVRPDPEELKNVLAKWRESWYPHRSAEELAAAGRRVLRSYSLEMLVEELADEAVAEPGHKVRYEIAHAKRLIAQKLAEDLTVAQVAEEVGLRDHYFSRLFRQDTGESFNEYVLRLRMEKAVQLLKASNLKVYEIAEQVGIPNYRYFSVLFRRFTGATPTDYKKDLFRA